MWYGLATTLVFTLFYVMAARTWSRYTTDDLTTNERMFLACCPDRVPFAASCEGATTTSITT